MGYQRRARGCNQHNRCNRWHDSQQTFLLLPRESQQWKWLFKSFSKSVYSVHVQLLTMLIPDVSLASYCNCMQQSCSLMTPMYLFLEALTTKGYGVESTLQVCTSAKWNRSCLQLLLSQKQGGLSKRASLFVSLVEISWLPRLFTCPELRTSADASIAVIMLAKRVSPASQKHQQRPKVVQ